MKKSSKAIKILFLLMIGLGCLITIDAFAEKKATEGSNEADVEFYEPTPKKPDPKKPDPKKPEPKKVYPTGKILPKTGEGESSYQMSLIGISLLLGLGIVIVKYKKVGETNEN